MANGCTQLHNRLGNSPNAPADQFLGKWADFLLAVAPSLKDLLISGSLLMTRTTLPSHTAADIPKEILPQQHNVRIPGNFIHSFTL